MTKQQEGVAIRFGYFRELLTVSKMISRSRVIAIPTNADWGVLEPATVASTPNLHGAMK